MKNTGIYTFLLLLVLAFCSCQQTSPDKVIGVTVLNTNQVTAFFRPRFFSELLERKKQNSIPVIKDGKTDMNGTAMDYVKMMAIDRVNGALTSVNEIEETEETKPLIGASKDLLEFGKKIFENDYVAVAKMIDEGKPQTEIDAAISSIFETNDAALTQKVKILDDLAMPYAKKHGVDLRVI